MPSCPRCDAVMDADEVACPLCGYRPKEESVYHTDYTPQELLDLGLSPQFVQFVFFEPKPDLFRYRCESRHSGWACYVPPNVSAVYPLWTCNADVTAVWVRRDRIEFVRLNHDDAEVTVLGRTEQGLLLGLFLALVEDEDWTDPAKSLRRLQEMADFAGFRHLAELNEWHERNGSAHDFHERWDRFAESIDRKSTGPGSDN
jgi:hypothetical protein